MFNYSLDSINLIHVSKITTNDIKKKITYYFDGKIETQTFADSTEYDDAVAAIADIGFILIGDTYYNKDRLSIVTPNGTNVKFDFLGNVVISHLYDDVTEVEDVIAEIDPAFIEINGKWYQGKQIHVAKLNPTALTIAYDYLGMDDFSVTYADQSAYDAAVEKLAAIGEGGGSTSNKVKTPKFTPSAGGVTSGTEVTITCATSGATIHYTTDGTTPDATSDTYSSPIAITADTTIKAIAIKDGMDNSSVASASYTIVLPTVATPTFTPSAGEVLSGTEVTIACATDGATIYYTTDGSTPTEDSDEYTDPIVVTAQVTIKAIGIKEDYQNSTVASATYKIGQPTAETPTFTPSAGEVVSGTTVALACATEGAVIHYTTNGSTPTASSSVYSDPIAITATTTIKAIAIADGYKNSSVGSATYTIKEAVLYSYSGIYNSNEEEGDKLPDPITQEWLESLVPDYMTKRECTGKALTDSEIHGDDDEGYTRYVYAYPKSYGLLSTYQPIGGIEVPIDNSFTHVEITIDGVAYYCYYLTDSIDTNNNGIIYA